jgi:hypothetical protein
MRWTAGKIRSPLRIHRLLVSAILAAATILPGYAVAKGRQKEFKSPDGKFVAVVVPVDKKKGFEERESRISIVRPGGAPIGVHDFSSEDGEHGYGVIGAQWTPDSQFFVCRMSNSGGHSPLYVPVVFWSRRARHFYQLKAYTADRIFTIASPDKILVVSWPDLQPVTVSLSSVKESDVTELH